MSLIAMTAVTVGLHVGSVHVPHQWYYENANTGVYVRADGWQAGVYRNSYRRTTAYFGAMLPVGPVDVLVGVSTGYQRKCWEWDYQGEHGRTCQGFHKGAIGPALAASYALPKVVGVTPRLWVMPRVIDGKLGAVGHLSVEW